MKNYTHNYVYNITSTMNAPQEVTQDVMNWVNKAIDTYERLAELNNVHLNIESDEMLFIVRKRNNHKILWIEDRSNPDIPLVNKSLNSGESIEEWFEQYKFVPDVVEITVITIGDEPNVTLQL